MSRFAFEIRLSSPELKDTLLVDTVAFDGYARRRNIEACIRDAATGLVKKPSVKMKKRTVVLYDGSIVKRQMNGITLVPRNPTRYDARYTELLDEAERQEREAEVTVQAASDRYQDEIARKVEKIWSSATIYIGLRTR